MSKILSSLNPTQQEAVRNTHGPLLILAGAGSGKTRALMHRIAYLIHEKNVKPWNILAVTFTNKAAGEMKERLITLLDQGKKEDAPFFEKLFGGGEEERFIHNREKEFINLPLVGTFHSICVRILRKDIEKMGRKRDFVIYDQIDSKSVMRQIIKDLGLDEKQYHYKAVLGQISKVKNELIGPKKFSEQCVSNMYTQTISHLYTEYEKRLFKNNALDFDALLFQSVKLLSNYEDVREYYQERWHYVHVDEYQDTNIAQYKLIKLLTKKYRHLCVIGDNDQSIYSFRGADMRNILEFQKDYPDAKVIKLEQNYRSTQNIIKAADSVISKNKNRPEKKLWTDNMEGDKVQVWSLMDEREEAEEIARELEKIVRSGEGDYGDFVVLYRTNAQSRMVEEALVRHGFPYKVIGGVKFYARKEIKDILAYLSVIKNQADEVALKRIINVPPRKIGQKTIDKIQQYAEIHEISLWEAICRADEIESLSDGAKKSLNTFAEVMQHIQDAAHEIPVEELIKKVISKSGYYDWLMDGTEEAKMHYENLLELVSVAQKYSGLSPWDSLSYFLEEVALVADVDSVEDESQAILLMTLHTAKGLEFPYVFIAGCEENIFPHVRSLGDEQQVEEERRLMYVGMTRAQKKLYLMYVNRRMLYGDVQMNQPSRFLFDIPEELVDHNQDKDGFESQSDDTYEEQDFDWNQDTENEAQVSGEDLQVGDIVMHAAFGRGEIIDRVGDIVGVRFENRRVGEKRFAVNIAPLKKI